MRPPGAAGLNRAAVLLGLVTVLAFGAFAWWPQTGSGAD
jgi:hypothetical protein